MNSCPKCRRFGFRHLCVWCGYADNAYKESLRKRSRIMADHARRFRLRFERRTITTPNKNPRLFGAGSLIL